MLTPDWLTQGTSWSWLFELLSLSRLDGCSQVLTNLFKLSATMKWLCVSFKENCQSYVLSMDYLASKSSNDISFKIWFREMLGCVLVLVKPCGLLEAIWRTERENLVMLRIQDCALYNNCLPRYTSRPVSLLKQAILTWKKRVQV